MNIRKHVDGFAVFLIILSSIVFIYEYLTFPNFKVSPVRVTAPPTQPPINRPQLINFNVRQVSLDYINKKSYTELSLFRQLDQPAPETVWVTTTYFSPDSTRAEDWTTITEIRHPFSRGDGEVFVAAANWDLPPALDKPGAGYFARVYVSSESQGNFSPPDYHAKSDIANAVPVVVHWPDTKGASARTAKKFSR